MYAAATDFQYVGVDHGSGHISVAKQLLHRTNVVPGLEHGRCKGMPQGVRCSGFDDAGTGQRPLERSLEGLIVHMVTANYSGAGIN